jgi:hypothetical protein
LEKNFNRNVHNERNENWMPWNLVAGRLISGLPIGEFRSTRCVRYG